MMTERGEQDAPPSAPIELPFAARRALAILEDGGHEAWAVGGFVRDALLGRPCADVDIACSAPWETARDLFAAQDVSVIETGAAHGTVTAIVDGTPVEVTSFRVDGPSSDHRHPDRVSAASSIKEDLARRDFTVNAIAYHPARGLCDPYGGTGDLARRVLRAVGDPAARFAEDALRILRACRFASQLGFAIDEGALRAMNAQKRLVAGVSAERVAHELGLLLVGPFACEALLGTAEAISVALPEIVATRDFDQRTPYHCYDVFEHTARVVGACPPEAAVRWAALCHDLGKPATFFLDEGGRGHFYGHALVSAQIAEGVMRRLKLPRRLAERVVSLVRHHDDEIAPTHKAVRRALRSLGGDVGLFRSLCALQKADSLAHAPAHRSGAKNADALLRVLDEVVEGKEAFTRSRLAVDGRDVMAAGVEAGPEVGAALRAALEAVIEGRVENEREALLAFVRERAAQ